MSDVSIGVVWNGGHEVDSAGGVVLGAALAFVGGVAGKQVEELLRREHIRPKLFRRIFMTFRKIRDASTSLQRRKPRQEIGVGGMTSLIDAWSNYQRLADDIGVIGDQALEIEVEDTMQL